MMQDLYSSFLGIDIGKHEFVCCLKNGDKTNTYKNNRKGFDIFLKEYSSSIPNGLIILEPTGGYESKLMDHLFKVNASVHRADARKVKNFIRSFGQQAKTDEIDAKALAQYGYERQKMLSLFEKPSEHQQVLKLLVERRLDLKQMLVQEKNRYQAPLNAILRSGIKKVITCLEKQISDTEDQIDKIMKKDPLLTKKKETLVSVPGIGQVTAALLLALIPELGSLDRKK